MPTCGPASCKAGFVDRRYEVLRRPVAGHPSPTRRRRSSPSTPSALRAQLESLGGPVPDGTQRAVPRRRARHPVGGLWVADGRAVPPVGDDHVGASLGPGTADRIVLHLHGGAYVLGSPETHRGLAAAISRTSQAQVLLPRYRLAPEHRFPAALDDAVAAYRWLVETCGFPADRIAISGDSAGGGLALAMMLRCA